MTNNYLSHVGVLGMKWGRRRARTPSSDHSTSAAIRKKKTFEMSNEEIKVLAQRLRLERELSDLNPSRATRGRKLVTGVLENIGKVAVATAATVTLIESGKKLYAMAKITKG